MLAELLTCLNEHDQQAEKNRWQKYVQNCIIRSASKAGTDIWEVRSRANLGSLPIQELDDLTFVFSRPRR
jgi:hypothetical protein